MNNSLLELGIIVLLLLANGVFAMAEIAVVSARPARLKQMADEGDHGAAVALELATQPTQFLATVQTGITMVGILAGAFSGATVAHALAARLETIPALAPYSRLIAVAAVVLLVTYLSLVIGELVPKRIGLNRPEVLASKLAPPMRRLSRLAGPAVGFIGTSTDVVLRLLRVAPATDAAVTPEEVRVLLAQGAESGTIREHERDMMDNVLRLGTRRVDAVMTPRTRIVWLDVDDTQEELREKIKSGGHSRYPVAEGTLENVLGTVRAVDLLARALAGEPIDVRLAVKRPVFVPENVSALRVLETLKDRQAHVALVTDEHGGLQGMVTHNDIMQEIAGALPASAIGPEAGATRRADGSWLLDGMMDIEDVRQVLDLAELPDSQSDYHTLGGFVITHIGRIPQPSDQFEFGGRLFEVVDMDGLRVDKVLVSIAHDSD